jgi:hypothetical protein
VISRRALCVVGLALVACPSKNRGPNDVSGEACETRLADVPFSAPSPDAIELPRSHISVDFEASVTALDREIGRQVPTRLSTVRGMDIGAPGEASFTVDRGSLNLAVTGDRLDVTIPVAVEVEVCKPLGPFCPTYGRCSPRLAARVSVPALLSADYEIPRSRVSIGVTRGCTIAGFDATPEIRKAANQQTSMIQSRIDRSIPKLRPYVDNVWRTLHVPVSLGNTTCLRIQPDALTQARPSLVNRVLSARLSASGALSVEDPCAKPEEAIRPGPLPELKTGDAPDGVLLEVPVRIAWADVSAAITRSAGNQLLVKAEARGASKGRIAIGATLGGTVCGTAWLFAEPWFDAKTSRVRVRKVTLAPGQPEFPEIGRLIQTLEERTSIPLPVDVGSAPNALESMVEGLASDLPPSVQVRAEMEPMSVKRVLLDRDALVPIATLKGSAKTEVK